MSLRPPWDQIFWNTTPTKEVMHLGICAVKNMLACRQIGMHICKHILHDPDVGPDPGVDETMLLQDAAVSTVPRANDSAGDVHIVIRWHCYKSCCW
jgi:hypothetical protein